MEKKLTNLMVLLLTVLVMVMTGASIYVYKSGSVETANGERQLPIYCVETKEKKIAISFDAAWGNEYTAGILDILDKYKIKSTFFLVGFWVDQYPEDVRKIYAKGHEVENHSLTHPNLTQCGPEQVGKELDETSVKIEALTGKKTTLIRPPFGAYDNNMMEIATQKGYRVIQWDVDSLDWKEMSSDQIAERVIRNVKNGSIVLFHNNAQYILTYLPVIIEKLQAEGYEIVPVGDLILKENYYMDHTGKQCNNQAEKGAAL